MKILQIMPGNGWKAQFKNEDGGTFVEPLVAWALVERTHDADTNDEAVVGIISEGKGTTTVEHISSFDRYLSPDEE